MARIPIGLIALLLCVWGAGARAQGQISSNDTSPHKVSFVNVDKGVNLEVLDWGGSGRALVFLAGLGNTAHDFDSFALRFIGNHHVYGITRRGFGQSDKPALTDANYVVDRLGEDVLAVIAALKLDRPILAGHSISGEELSWIGTYHREAVSGLIYLDAIGGHSFYNAATGNFGVDTDVLRTQLEALSEPSTLSQDNARIKAILNSDELSRFEATLRSVSHEMDIMLKVRSPPPLPSTDPRLPYMRKIQANQRRFTEIRGPILAIVAIPHDYEKNPPVALKESTAMDMAYAKQEIDAFQSHLPNARVVRLPYANHSVFRSNATDVEREMNAFMQTLK
jgi:non-heme chloroperoxidase